MTSILLYIVLGAIFIPAILYHAYRFRRKIELNSVILEQLQFLAKQSLETSDVPVGAVLLYNGEIIGEGFNTVLRDKNAGAHAEINALSSAIASLGHEKFSALERKHLILVSTFEPCLMCVGACINHNIPAIYFLEGKDLQELWTERKLFTRYLFRRNRVLNNGEQIALFNLHPNYPKRNRK